MMMLMPLRLRSFMDDMGDAQRPLNSLCYLSARQSADSHLWSMPSMAYQFISAMTNTV